jgi:hypothetical protein
MPANSIGIVDKAFGSRFGYNPGYIVGNLDVKYIDNSITCSIKGRCVVGHFPFELHNYVGGLWNMYS